MKLFGSIEYMVSLAPLLKKQSFCIVHDGGGLINSSPVLSYCSMAANAKFFFSNGSVSEANYVV